MKSVLVLGVVLTLGTLGMALAEEPAAAPSAEALIKMSPGSAKILGEPVVKEFPAMKAVVASVKAADYAPEGGYTVDQAGVHKAYEEMSKDGFTKLMHWAHATGTFPTGPAFGMFYDDPTTTEPSKLTAKLAFPVPADAKPAAGVTIEDIPAMTAVMLQFEGPYEESNNAWFAVMTWMEQNGYAWAGAPMEVYHKGPMDVKDPAQYLTEIRIPVAKVDPTKAETKE